MFDYIFVTHLPSFYKINLYNELSKKLNIYVIFVGKGSAIRTNDFTSGKINFDYCFLSDGKFEERNVIKSSIKLFFVLRKIKFKKIVVGGWDLLEYWLIVLLKRKSKNALALESGVGDSIHKGLKRFVKKLFLNRINTVFASGSSQKKLLEKLAYHRFVYITKGVGIINKVQSSRNNNQNFSGNFLYVGRLSEEKNLAMLIRVFNDLPQFKLEIVGSGRLEHKLKDSAGPNINFIAHVENKDINKVFLRNDVFVLPSLSEPWGLVVEEAFYFGLPVILSDRVGCAPELVKNGENGIIFDISYSDNLKKAIIEMSENYQIYHNKALEFDLDKKDKDQVDCYIRALSIN